MKHLFQVEIEVRGKDPLKPPRQVDMVQNLIEALINQVDYRDLTPEEAGTPVSVSVRYGDLGVKATRRKNGWTWSVPE